MGFSSSFNSKLTSTQEKVKIMNRVAKTSMYVKNLKMTRNIISTAQNIKKGQAMHKSRQRRWNLFVWPRLPGVRHILLMITLRTLHNTLSVGAGARSGAPTTPLPSTYFYRFSL